MASGSQGREQIIDLQGEKELLEELSAREPTFREVNRFLAQFQHSCHATCRNLEAGAGPAPPEVESRIWDSHMRINSRFRKLLLHFRDEQARKKRPVEERKLKHQYLKFISGAQQFYEKYLKFILLRSKVAPELAEAAAELRIVPVDVPTPANIAQELRNTLIESCYSTFIRLGDLSRYYQTELVADPKRREWNHVVNYYALAGSIKPTSGIFHNQLAIIARAEADHLQATYYLYRALCATESHPTAPGNLEIEFRKILNAWSNGKLAQSKDEKESLISSFTFLHAMCYKGVDFAERDDIENEVLDQMAIQLIEGSLDGDLLQKFCLVNIAAEAHARTKPDTNGNAPTFFLQLNVKTFFTLLRVLLAEVEKLSKPICQILPALRNYSSWLVVNSFILVSKARDSPLGVQIKEFWKIYANTLTLLTSSFSVPDIPYLDYLLQEDRDTLGFSPLMQDGKSPRYVDEQGNIKPRSIGPASVDRVKAEMLFRVRELVTDGLDLVVRKKIPISLASGYDKNIFLYEEEGFAQFSTTTNFSSEIAEQEVTTPKQCDNHMENEESAMESVSPFDDMDKMVDALVNSEADPGESCAPKSGAATFQPWPRLSIDTNGASMDYPFPGDNVLRSPYSPTIPPEAVTSYSPGPPLPSITKTPFTPQPGEVSPRTRPSTATHSGLRRSSGYDVNPMSPLNYTPLQSNPVISAQHRSSTPVMSQNSNGFTPTGSSMINYQNWQTVHRSFTERVPCIGVPNANDPRLLSSPFNPSGYPPGSYATSSARAAGIIGQTPPSGQGG
ncbi:hypothetical protein D8B26_005826 [Coccidioides posadasii str. Silveira]|uniref:Uncharacterized protein n=2 Tax=Coccidioides posadasii TaxID=199306 RepID=E9DB21_COCPS|nr:hypothetical protein CPC735_026060 [Coccidioides posadasii C735 delta SOWgp]EER27270.1 hypothetical protein CPC735_026060 [Coccidioides posadasii C735 delta SOWgp]EFW16507.1 conserved hypothetical protein [Coccidioides posadasii str. Silveira]QVM11175.1 hypothetical protein D8B26_005826 [Coccidioides posadasii str. Silveira]|eukprot:XP_003069415.1 hypothetical protein CPC735_026060 [Coccidioides posadasii C735 delta SOWgp]